jgi:hypothetical protein
MWWQEGPEFFFFLEKGQKFFKIFSFSYTARAINQDEIMKPIKSIRTFQPFNFKKYILVNKEETNTPYTLGPEPINHINLNATHFHIISPQNC